MGYEERGHGVRRRLERLRTGRALAEIGASIGVLTPRGVRRSIHERRVQRLVLLRREGPPALALVFGDERLDFGHARVRSTRRSAPIGGERSRGVGDQGRLEAERHAVPINYCGELTV